MTVDPDALEETLAKLDIDPPRTSRRHLAPGEDLVLAGESATFVYVRRGLLARRGEPAATPPREPAADASTDAGDAWLVAAAATTGRCAPVVFTTSTGADLVVADLRIIENVAARALPDVIGMRGFAELEPAAAALADAIGFPAAHSSPRSGDPVICRMIVTTLVLAVVRAWATAGCAPAGWPHATMDPYLRCVIAAIHADPGRDWSVEALATLGAMSRTVFAERFRSALGRSPAAYVTQVRMDGARRLLSAGHSVSDVARSLGYASDEGFSRAFRRHAGVVPSAWRVRHSESVSA